MMGGFKNLYECVKAFSETNLTEDLKKFDVPTLIIQGEDDQVVPIDVSGRRSVKLIPGAKLIVYPGAPHGITDIPVIRPPCGISSKRSKHNMVRPNGFGSWIAGRAPYMVRRRPTGKQNCAAPNNDRTG